jgi:pimeloyl-ACP methyl ester carboxylesterase
MRKLLTLSSLLLIGASGLLVTPSSVTAQAAQDETKLKARDIRRLQGQLKDWFDPVIESVELSNSGDGSTDRGRKKIQKLNRDARKARQKFIDSLEDRGEKLGGVLSSVPDLLAIFEGCFPFKRSFSRGDVSKEWVDPKNKKENAYFMRRPKGYDPKESWPLVFTLTSRSGLQAEEYLEKVWAGESDFIKSTIFAAPELPADHDLSTVVDIRSERDVSAEAPKRTWFLRNLGALLTTYRLDTDRVYLEAVGDATPFAMRIVSLFPDRFGGLILRDPQGIENLTAGNCLLVPILIVGAKDGENVTKLSKMLEDAGHKKFKVLEGKGEAPYADTQAEVAEWLKTAKRDLFESEVQLMPAHDAFRRGYWVEIAAGSYLNQVGPEDRPMVKVSADREKNRIEVTARNIEQVRLYLNDAIVDLDKEITLVLNGKIRQDKRTRSVRRLADWVLRRGDSRFLFVTMGVYDIPKAGE